MLASNGSEISVTSFLPTFFIFELKMKNLTNEQLLKYLDKIETSTLLSYGVYQIENDGLELFEYIKGDQNSIMGLPIRDIINYIKLIKK